MTEPRDKTAKRRRTEETLRESEAGYKALFAGAPQGMLVADLETRQFRHANPAMCRMFGYTEEEFLRIGVADIHPKESLSYVLAEFETLAQGERLLSTDLPCQRKDGSLFYADVNATLVVLDGRKCNVGFFTDVTEDKKAAEALRESEARYKALFAGAPEGMLVADLETRQFRHANPAMCRMFGYTEGEFLRIGVADIHPKESLSYVLAEFEAQARGEKLLSADLPCQRKDGSLFYANVNTTMVVLDGRMYNVGFFTDVSERKQAEQALRDSDQQLRNVLEVSRDLIYKLNLQTRTYDYVSPSSLRLVGFAPQEIVAMGLEGVIERFHPGDRERFRTHPSRLPDDTVEGHEAPTVEYRWQCRDGEYRWLSDNRAFVLDEGGRALSLVGTVRDVTEDKRAEEALRESEQRFRNVLDVSRDFIYKIDLRTGTYDYASPYVLELTGFTPEEVVAMGLRGVAERIHPEDGKRLTEGLKDLTKDWDEGQRNSLSVYRWKRKDGEYRWFSDNNVFIRYSNEQPAALIGAVRDITTEKQAEEALRESEEKYRQLVERLQEGVWALDEDANTTFANPRMAEILGYTVSEMLGRPLFSFMDEQERELAGLKLERRRQGIAEQYELEFLRKDGTRVYASLAANPVTDRNGNYIGAVAAVTDITDKKQAEEEIANRLKMEFAIAQASTLLSGSEDADAGLDLALRILGEAFGADRGHIFLFRDNDTRMDNTSEWCAPGVEPQIDNLQDLDCAAIPWWMGKLAQNEPIIMTDTSAAPPDAVATKKSWKTLNIRSLLAVPLLSDGKLIGYVRFANMESAFNEREEDIRLLRLASESIASFIQRQRAGEDKRKAYESIVMLLATGAEARDPFTEHHLSRIRGFAEAIAAEMGLPPDETREIGLSSLLHDLGKMRVPDSILTKPGPLSQAEWRVIKQHPTWGEELLATHPWLETARQIARWHHERWDGTGYPDGLCGEEIPLCAAIVAVADGFDAMISDRPYKKAWPPRQAIVEIRAQKGRQYSPIVVKAFNRALRKGEIGRIASADSACLPELSEAA